MTTPKLQMPELVVGQAGKELTHNQALAALDQLAQAVVVDKDLAAPPGSPANGSMYIVAAGSTGAWADNDGKLTYWLASVAEWTFITPADGWSVWVTDESVRYERKADAWVVVATGGGGMANPMTTAGDLIVGGSAGVPNRLPVGATGKVLGVTEGSPAWVDPPASGGGLTSLTEAKASSSPNGIVPVVSLSVSIAEANGDVVLAAKGSGATIASVPNDAASGGAKRGNYATDFQKSRGSASQVASGAYSVLGGGRLNTAYGQEAVVCGGQSNTSSGAQAFIGSGITNTASSNGSSILGGGDNTTGGLWASVLGGQYNLANGSHSVASGRYASTRGIYGARAHASGSSAGEAQTADYVLRRLTQNATPVELTCDGTDPDTGTRIALPNNSAFAVKGKVVARATSSGDAKAWEFTGLIRRGASAGTTTIVSPITPVVIAEDSGASTWALAVTADTTNGSLTVTATGVAATNIRWTCHVESVETTG